MTAPIDNMQSSVAQENQVKNSALPSPKSFLEKLFLSLDEAQVRYCVLHSWKNLPEELPSDLDIAVHPQDRTRLARAFRLLHDQDFRLIQLINHNVNGYYFVFAWCSGHGFQTASLDVIFEHRRRGLILAGGEELTETRIQHDGFWVASPAAEFAYLLAKKSAKGKIRPEQAERMRELAVSLGETEAIQIAQTIFPGRDAARLVAACLNGTLSDILPEAHRRLWFQAALRKPFGLAKFFIGNAVRYFERWSHPNGVLIAVLGPDGVGKSSMIANLRTQFGSAFWGERYFHWRPQVIISRKQAPPVTDPHGKPSRGSFTSSLYLSGFLLDYLLGYAFVLRQLKPRTHFLLFDRYFYDVLVDPRRIRYGGPRWLARFYARLVPAPDVVILLDAETESILQRKSEVPRDELIRQRKAYRALPVDASRLHVIWTEGGLNETLREGTNAIARFMAYRFEEMHPEWLPAQP